MHELTEDVILHYGKKGMKWGVRNDVKKGKLSPDEGQKKLSALDKQMKSTSDPKKLASLRKEYGKVEDSINYSKSKGQNGNNPVSKATTRVKESLGSMSRERSWRKELANMDNMTNAQINKVASRIQMENDFKRLSNNKGISTKQDKKDYRTRANLNDAELQSRLQRLRAKDNLYRNVQEASRSQREAGMRVARTAAGVGIKYAMTGTVSTKDVGLAILKSNKPDKNMKKKAIESVLDKTNRVIVDHGPKKD